MIFLISTFDENGYAEPGSIYVQVKAAEALTESSASFVFDLDIRDYNLWRLEKLPVIFILFDASRRRAYWLAIQQYFREGKSRQPRKGASRVRVRVPRRQIVNGKAIEQMRALKRAVIDQEHARNP